MNLHLRPLTLTCALLIIQACLFLSPAAAAPRMESDRGIQVIINDLYFSVETTAIAADGTPMLPFRSIYELLGASVSWNAAERTARGERGSITVDLQVDNGVAVVNNERVILNISPRVISGRTLVPAWFFAESLGAEIDWDARRQVINISLAPVRGISLEAREMTLEQGETELLMADVFPDDAVNKNIIWYSSQPSVADVHNTGETSAVVAAVNPGTAIIVASTEEGGFVATCRVKVQQTYTPVTGVALNHNTLTLVEGYAPRVLVAQVFPETATDQEIRWASSNPRVATVQRHAVGRAIVTPLQEGRTIITVTTAEGEFVDACVVTVLD